MGTGPGDERRGAAQARRPRHMGVRARAPSVPACARAPCAGTALLHGVRVPAAAEATPVPTRALARAEPPGLPGHGRGRAAPGGGGAVRGALLPSAAGAAASARLRGACSPRNPLRTAGRAGEQLSPRPPPCRPRCTAQEEANTASDDGTPQSTAQLCSPLQMVLHSQELIAGYPGLSLSGCPDPIPG